MIGAVFTWGYGGKKPADLLRIVEQLKITHVVDCRRRPQTRIPGFSGAALRKTIEELPKRDWGFVVYTQRGNDGLGGYPPGSVMPENPPPVERAAMEALRLEAVERGARLLLVCAEKAPGECHRHITIALPLARLAAADREWWPAEVEIRHVFEGTLVDPIELQRAIDDPDPEAEYDCEEIEDYDPLAAAEAGMAWQADQMLANAEAAGIFPAGLGAARKAVSEAMTVACECRVPGPRNGNSRCRAPLRAVCQCPCHAAAPAVEVAP